MLSENILICKAKLLFFIENIVMFIKTSTSVLDLEFSLRLQIQNNNFLVKV